MKKLIDYKDKLLIDEFLNDYFYDIENELYLVNYENKTITPYFYYNRVYDHGQRTKKEFNYTFLNENTINVQITWESQSCRMKHIPWIKEEENIQIDISKI